LFGHARPWCGGMDRPFRRTGDDILENEDAARFQDAKDFALETFLIRDAHLHLDGDGMIKTIVVERCLQGTSALKCSAVGHTQQFRKPIGGVDETRDPFSGSGVRAQRSPPQVPHRVGLNQTFNVQKSAGRAAHNPVSRKASRRPRSSASDHEGSVRRLDGGFETEKGKESSYMDR